MKNISAMDDEIDSISIFYHVIKNFSPTVVDIILVPADFLHFKPLIPRIFIPAEAKMRIRHMYECNHYYLACTFFMG